MFNPIFGTLNNQMELQKFAQQREQACRTLAAQARNQRDFKFAHRVEEHARQIRPFVNVLPVFNK